MKEKNIILLISGFSLCTNFYLYDIPSALNYKLDFKTSLSVESWIGILYMCYSVPNIIFPVIFSYSIKSSIPKIIIFFSFLIFLGQFLFSTAIWTKRFEIAIIGRIILGIGSESCSIMQNKILSEYFKTEGMVSALTFYNCSGQLGTVLNFFLTPKIAQKASPLYACIFGCFLAFLAFISSFRRHYISENSQEILKDATQSVSEVSNETSIKHVNILNDICTEKSNVNDQSSLAIAIPISEDLSSKEPKNNIETEIDCLAKTVNNSKKGFTSSFKIIAAICFLYGLSSYPFFNIAPMMYQTRFKMSSHKSSYMVSYIEGISIILSFFVAFLADKFGHILSFSVIGAFILLFSHIATLAFMKNSYISVILMGISIPMVTCFWFIVPRLVSDETYHIKLSILTCINNASYSVSPMIISAILSRDPTYFGVEMYFISVAILSLILFGLLTYNNISKNLRLNSANA